MELSDSGLRIWSWGPDGKRDTADDLRCAPKASSSDTPGDRESQLVTAARKGHLAEVRRLLRDGVDPDTRSAATAPLHSVALADSNRLEIARLLIEAGANVNRVSRPTGAAGRTPRTPNAGPSLVRSGAVPPLHNAVILNRGALAAFLLAHGAKLDIGEVSPLFNAVVAGHEEMIVLLLDAGADPNSRDPDSLTPLHRATGNVSATQLLLARGADPNARAAGSQTPLMHAAGQGHDSALTILLRAGAEPDLATVIGNTALLLAADKGHTGSIVRLAAGGARVNAQNNRGQTALMAAAWHGDEAVVAALLDAGADPALKDRAGATALSLAERQGHARVARLIAQKLGPSGT
jgi:ankyrin repeat protein